MKKRKQKIKKPANRQKRKKLIKLLHSVTNNALIISAISGLLMVTSATMLHVYNGIQNNLSILDEKVTDLMSVNEETYVVCTSLVSNRKLLPYFQQKSLLDARQELRHKMDDLLKQRGSLGKYISYSTYVSTAEQVYWTNALFKEGMNVCNLAILNTSELTAWRKQIQQQIKNDKIKHQTLFQISKDLLNYTVSFFPGTRSEFDQAYTAPKFNTHGIISKYQK